MNAPPEPITEKVSPGIDQIPFEGLEAIGEIFVEGEAKGYPRDQWKNAVGNIGFQRERCRHAMRHLWLWANGDRSENHLAKVAWFSDGSFLEKPSGLISLFSWPSLAAMALSEIGQGPAATTWGNPPVAGVAAATATAGDVARAMEAMNLRAVREPTARRRAPRRAWQIARTTTADAGASE